MRFNCSLFVALIFTVKAHPSALSIATAGDAEALRTYLSSLPPVAATGSEQDASASKLNKPKFLDLAAAAATGGSTLGGDESSIHQMTLEEALLDTDEAGRTALHLATRFDYLDCVSVILEAASKAGSELFNEVVGAMDGDEALGGTPLYVALRRGNLKVIMVRVAEGTIE